MARFLPAPSPSGRAFERAYTPSVVTVAHLQQADKTVESLSTAAERNQTVHSVGERESWGMKYHTIRWMPYHGEGDFTALVSVFREGDPMRTIFRGSCTRRRRGSAYQHETKEGRVGGVMLDSGC